MTQSHQPDPARTDPPENDSGTPKRSWSEALATLLAARASILEAESKIAAQDAISSLLKWIVAGVFLSLAWLLLIAGIIASIVIEMEWPIHWVIFGTSLAHLLAAAILMATMSSKKQNYFSITRSEFTKDREWLKNFQKPKSNN